MIGSRTGNLMPTQLYPAAGEKAGRGDVRIPAASGQGYRGPDRQLKAKKAKKSLFEFSQIISHDIPIAIFPAESGSHALYDCRSIFPIRVQPSPKQKSQPTFKRQLGFYAKTVCISQDGCCSVSSLLNNLSKLSFCSFYQKLLVEVNANQQQPIMAARS
jgi:hypothetical protein